MRRTVLIVTPLLIALLVVAGASYSQTASIKDRFLASNPNDGWEYGFLDEQGNFTVYNTTFDDKQGIAGWALNNTPGPEGDVTINYTDQPIDRYGVHWEPGEICIHAPLYGRGAVVRWVSSDATDLQIDFKVTQASGVNGKVEIWVDDNRIVNEGIVSVSDAETSAPSGEQERTPATLTRSATASVKSGSKVQLVVPPGEEMLPYHLGAFIKLSSMTAEAKVTVKTCFGVDTPKQVKIANSETSKSEEDKVR